MIIAGSAIAAIMTSRLADAAEAGSGIERRDGLEKRAAPRSATMAIRSPAQLNGKPV